MALGNSAHSASTRISHSTTQIIHFDHLSLPELKDDALLEHDMAGPNTAFWMSSSRLRSVLPRISRNAANQDENMVDKVGQTPVDNVDSVLKVLVNNL